MEERNLASLFFTINAMPKLTKTERIHLALKEFPQSDHNFINSIHELDPGRTATKREREFIRHYKNKNGKKVNQDDLVKWTRLRLNLSVNQSTISRILRKKYDEGSSNIQNVRRFVPPKFPNIDEKVAQWFFKHQHNVNMSGDLIRRKAEKIRDGLGIKPEDFKVSAGWLDGFKNRNGIRDRRRHGESGEVDMVLVESERPNLKKILDTYELKDIYNMDETGLFYQQEVSVCYNGNCLNRHFN